MKIRGILALLLCGALLLTVVAGCANDPENETTPKELSPEERQALLQEAYIYTLPLMIMDATNTKMTNTLEATDTQAPQNQFIHAQNLATAAFKDVVTPNVDTIYSQVFLDLSEDAVIIEFPRTDRFCSVEIMDAYTNCIAIIDTMTFDQESQKFIFTRAEQDVDIPEGMTKIVSPTDLVWVLVRTICYSPEDAVNVHAIQDQMHAYTLGQYESGTTDTPPLGTFDEAKNFIPVQYISQLSMQDYFERANQLMAANPPAPADAALMERLSEINVGPSLEFDSALFGEDAATLWKELVSGIAATCFAASQAYTIQNGQWAYYGDPIAEFGTAYGYRAFISLVGLGANPVSVAVYPKTDVDADGGRLSGENTYILHFDKDQLPPVRENGFWSVTVYTSSDNLLIDNPINRYCINDRSAVQYNEDGSLDIYIQKDAPTDDKLSNWLPVSADEFHLVLRIYYPDDTVVNNQWQTPQIHKTN